MKMFPENCTDSLQNSEFILWSGHVSHKYYIGSHIIGVLLWIILIGFLINLSAYLQAKRRRYYVTNLRIIVEEGFLSRSQTEIRARDIKLVQVYQSVMERLFNLGTINLATAGTNGIEVSLVGIENLNVVKTQLDQLILN